MHFNSRGFGAPFLIFENSDCVNNFVKYLEKNSDELNSITPDYIPKINQSEYESVISLEFLCKAKMIFDKKANI